jgi:UPF0755 protein
MKKDIYKILGIIIAAVVIVGLCLILLPWPFGRSAGSVEFKIQKGQGLSETARLLAEQSLINNRLVFVAYTVMTEKERSFKAGRYLIPPSASINSLVNMFSKGLSESEDIGVTIPEGTNLADMDLIFAKTGLTKKGDLLSSEIFKQEGYLFPDTYRFSKEDLNGVKIQSADIVGKLQENFKEKTSGLFKNLSQEKIKETVIIASLLEKEVQSKDEMRLVAGIIEKRISVGMPLQIDATVAYGVCYPKFVAGQYCDTSLANIIDNLKSSSAYNTYQRKGLPIAPISNPGIEAIKAALNPQPSDYLYYLTTKDGITIFSKTSAEHEAARRKYLR